jgi:hypothetical protein
LYKGFSFNQQALGLAEKLNLLLSRWRGVRTFDSSLKILKQELDEAYQGSEGETYQKMLIANTQSIVKGLGGKYTPFAAK